MTEISKSENPSFEEQVRALLPKSIDEIITINRDKAQLRIASADDINPLQCEIEEARMVTGVVSRWCLIALELRNETDGCSATVHLTGYNETLGRSWMTSLIKGIDLENGLLRTKSGSLYRMNGQSTDAPDLPVVCATLNSWGMGSMLGLPHIFF